jgi:hypothetical protein
MGITVLAHDRDATCPNKESSTAINQALLSPLGIRDNGVIGSECGACTVGWGCVCDPALGVDN